MNKKNRIWVGLKWFADKFLRAFCFLLATMRAIAFFDPNYAPNDIYWLFVAIGLSLAYALFHLISIHGVTISIPTTESKFEIKFGDIFNEKGVIVIPVNEYFDSELGELVARKSLHGKFILDILDGRADKFDEMVKYALRNDELITKKDRDDGRQNYPIGTTAKIDAKGKRYLLAALSYTDPKTNRASATTIELGKCLKGVWEKSDIHSQGECTAIPLIGSGLSRVDLPPEPLIQFILTSFIESAKKTEISGKVILVLDKRYKFQINLNALKEGWS